MLVGTFVKSILCYSFEHIIVFNKESTLYIKHLINSL